MPELILLGTSNAVPDPQHENTHMLLVGQQRVVLVDAGSYPLLRMDKLGVDFNRLTDLVVTHFHPDHVSGIPIMLMNMWLMGRKLPLDIYGLDYTLDRLENLMEAFSWRQWPEFYPLAYHRLPAAEMTPVLDCPEFRILASPVSHYIPTLGLRVEFPASGRAIAYSCDTRPCPQVERLAEHADILFHECSGEQQGHSSAAQAGQVAKRAGCHALYLIHYPTGHFAHGDLVAEAGAEFPGPVVLTEDLMSLKF